MTIKYGEAKIEVEVNLDADARVKVGRTLADTLLVGIGEYPAALIVTAVDLEYTLVESLRRYRDESEGLVKNNKVKEFINNKKKFKEFPLGKYKEIFDIIYNDSDCPDYSEIDKDDWTQYEGKLQKLIDIRNGIAHDRGVYRKVRDLEHETYDSEEKIRDLIYSIYDFCQQHPA